MLADLYRGTMAQVEEQDRIQGLREGDALQIRSDSWGRYLVATEDGVVIGALSHGAMEALAHRRIAPGEVRVRHIVHWTDPEHGLSRWLVLPLIRVYRADAFAADEAVDQPVPIR